MSTAELITAAALIEAERIVTGYVLTPEDLKANAQLMAGRPYSQPLSAFLALSSKSQEQYVARWYGHDSSTSDEDRQDVPRTVAVLQDLAINNGKLPAQEKPPARAGDKWISPGRMVCSWPDLDPTARLVMFVLAAHGDNNGEGIWISQSKIARYLGFSKRTVQRAMQRLEDEKAILMTAEPRQHQPPTWRLNRGPGVT
jgi:hypothetical protein